MICINSACRGAESGTLKMVVSPKRAVLESMAEKLGAKMYKYHDNAWTQTMSTFCLLRCDLRPSIKPLQGSTESFKWTLKAIHPDDSTKDRGL